MSTPTVFLYNLDNPRGAKIRRLCMPLGLRTALVPRESYGLPLGELAAGKQSTDLLLRGKAPNLQHHREEKREGIPLRDLGRPLPVERGHLPLF